MFTGAEWSKMRNLLMPPSPRSRNARWVPRSFIVMKGGGKPNTGLFVFEEEGDECEMMRSCHLGQRYCNAKYLGGPTGSCEGEEAGYIYMRLVPSPDQIGLVETVRVRCRLRDTKTRKTISNFTTHCISQIRTHSKWASAHAKAFDAVLLPGRSVAQIEPEFQLWMRAYLIGITEVAPGVPNPKDGTYKKRSLYTYMYELIDAVLACKSIDDKCRAAARTFSAFAARATRDLLQLEENPGYKGCDENIFNHLQALQEYQLRQLVEMAMFSGVRHGMPALFKWVCSTPAVQALDAQITANRDRFATEQGNRDIENADWLLRLRNSGRFTTTSEVAALLMPAIDEVQAIGRCDTPVQKVRLWAEALVTCTSLINNTMPEGKDPVGAPDLPSIVLFLACATDGIQGGIAAHAKLAALFCLDSMGQDKESYQLPHGGLYSDVGDQYAFNAEKRSVSPQFSLLWLDDTLDMIADMGGLSFDDAQEAAAAAAAHGGSGGGGGAGDSRSPSAGEGGRERRGSSPRHNIPEMERRLEERRRESLAGSEEEKDERIAQVGLGEAGGGEELSPSTRDFLGGRPADLQEVEAAEWANNARHWDEDEAAAGGEGGSPVSALYWEDQFQDQESAATPTGKPPPVAGKAGPGVGSARSPRSDPSPELIPDPDVGESISPSMGGTSGIFVDGTAGDEGGLPPGDPLAGFPGQHGGGEVTVLGEGSLSPSPMTLGTEAATSPHTVVSCATSLDPSASPLASPSPIFEQEGMECIPPRRLRSGRRDVAAGGTPTPPVTPSGLGYLGSESGSSPDLIAAEQVARSKAEQAGVPPAKAAVVARVVARRKLKAAAERADSPRSSPGGDSGHDSPAAGGVSKPEAPTRKLIEAEL